MVMRESTHSFRVNLGVQPGVANEVDNPLLSIIHVHVQLLGKAPGGFQKENSASQKSITIQAST
jgi:hypothetical protein